MNYKKSNLSVCEVSESDYSFLNDEMIELLNEEIGINDLKMLYSLGHSQGDGLRFEGSINYELAKKLTGKKLSKKTEKAMMDESGSIEFEAKGITRHYYHKNTMDITVNSYRMNEKAADELEKYAELILESLKNLSAEMEKAGYAFIEAEEKDNLFQHIFKDFLTLNGIESDRKLFDIDYSEKEKAGYTNIYTGSDSIYKGLWVELPEIKKSSRVVEFYEFI